MRDETVRRQKPYVDEKWRRYIDPILERVDKAEKKTLLDMHKGVLQSESWITSTFLAYLKTEIEDLASTLNLDMRFLYKSFESEASDSPETITGADFVGAFHFGPRGRGRNKGFLSQAKIAGHRVIDIEDTHGFGWRLKPGRPSRFIDLQRQVDNMSRISRMASSVFVYHEKGIFVFDAASIVTDGNKARPPIWSVREFFEKCLECPFGDPNLIATDEESLMDLMDRVGAKEGFLLYFEY